jgi:hypothetical protein
MMWSAFLALLEPIAAAFASAFGAAVAQMFAQQQHDGAVAEAEAAREALAASEAAREAERAMSTAAQPMTDDRLLKCLDGGRL